MTPKKTDPRIQKIKFILNDVEKKRYLGQIAQRIDGDNKEILLETFLGTIYVICYSDEEVSLSFDGENIGSYSYVDEEGLKLAGRVYDTLAYALSEE